MPADTSCTATAASPVEAAWAVLAAFDRIADWAPRVDHSSHLRGPATGVGATRRVQVGRTVLVEEVVAWEPEHRLAYRIEGLPPRLGRLTTTWSLDPTAGGTRVTVSTTVDAGPRPPQQVAARIAARVIGRANRGLLAGLVERLVTTTGATT